MGRHGVGGGRQRRRTWCVASTRRGGRRDHMCLARWVRRRLPRAHRPDAALARTPAPAACAHCAELGGKHTHYVLASMVAMPSPRLGSAPRRACQLTRVVRRQVVVQALSHTSGGLTHTRMGGVPQLCGHATCACDRLLPTCPAHTALTQRAWALASPHAQRHRWGDSTKTPQRRNAHGNSLVSSML